MPYSPTHDPMADSHSPTHDPHIISIPYGFFAGVILSPFRASASVKARRCLAPKRKAARAARNRYFDNLKTFNFNQIAWRSCRVAKQLIRVTAKRDFAIDIQTYLNKPISKKDFWHAFFIPFTGIGVSHEQS